jgi:hypothetical protein
VLCHFNVLVADAGQLVQVDGNALFTGAADQLIAVVADELVAPTLPGVEVVGRLACAARLDVVAEVVQRDGDLAARLVDPCADLGGFVDGDAGGYDDGGRDDDA